MPTDVMQETEITPFCDPLSDDLNPRVIEKIKQIWIENNCDSERFYSNYVLQSSESVNSDILMQCTVDSVIKEVQYLGFIIGQELEDVKAKSRRSLMQQMSNHISMNFQSLYGKENSGVRQNYFQIGVRVPSKEHVSEIVGKQGMKIKEIREKTGALIITPGESEDHVFIIEATPQVALNVAKFIDERASEITTNRVRDNFQKTFTFNPSVRYAYNKQFIPVGSARPILATGVIEVPKNIVGRIIGTHGSIITTIQKDTGTEIRSPPKDNHLANNNSRAKFEILVYQKSKPIDMQEAVQRIKNAKQLIAHVALHQMERIRAEESPFSNYRIKNFTLWENNEAESQCGERNSLTDKERLLNYQMQTMAWLWTDVDRLDDQVSEEVVLRILEESKNKSKFRTDFGNFDNGNIGMDRFEDNLTQMSSPFSNGYETSPYSPSQFFDLSPTIKSASPNHLNGSQREVTASPYLAPPNFQNIMLTHQRGAFSSNADLSSTISASDYGRPNTIHCKEALTPKSYAEHLKASSTSHVLNQAPPTLASPLPTTRGHSHGVIGDHIKKLNPSPTAQFNKI